MKARNIFSYRNIFRACGAIVFIFVIDYHSLGLTGVPFGIAEAKIALWRGVYAFKTEGYYGPCQQGYFDLLRRKYGVRVSKGGMGCIYQPWLAKYAGSYNSVTKPIILQKYGKDIFAEWYVESAKCLADRYSINK